MRHLKTAAKAALVFVLCLMAVFSSFAVDPVITTAGSSASSTVTLTVAAAAFSVTVPTSLPVNVAADGTVTVSATNPKLRNNSAGPVRVTDIAINGNNGWSVIDYTADLSAVAVNTKQLALSINGKKAVSEKSAMLASFTAIETSGEQEFTYAANIPAQSAAISGVEVASVTFTIGWDT